MGAVLGIVGTSPDAHESTTTAMCAAVSFRGQQRADRAGGDFRLATVQRTHEQGPTLVSNREATVIAACEGEIYNARELAQQLGLPREMAEGFGIIPALFDHHGKDFARHINGIFGIAVFDSKTRTLYLARDHAGSHSLFYASTGATTCFATTVKAIVATGHIKREISTGALDAYFACLAVSPPETLLKGVLAVRPGHVTIIRDGVVTEHPYWPFHECREDDRKSESAFAEEIRSVFTDAVRIRASSSGRYGTLVSGGVDTSAIATVLAQDRSREVHGFSIVFEEQAYSDAALQEHIYGRYPITRHQVVLTPEAFANVLEEGAKHFDTPVNDVAYVGMYKAMELVKDAGLDVAFEGEGSDEIFCTGHSHGERSIQPFLVAPAWLRRMTFGIAFRNMPDGPSLEEKVRRFGCRIGMPEHRRLSTWPPVMHDQMRRRLRPATNHVYYPYPQTRYYLSNARVRDGLNRYNYLLSRLFLPDDLLFKNERMAAAHGVTNRTPFVDYRLMELAFRVPAALKIRKPTATADMTKLIFKKAMKGVVPDAVLNRKKSRGFSQPTSVWYRGPLRDYVADLLLGRSSAIGMYLDGAEVRRIFDEHVSGRANLDYHLNSLIVLELWMRDHA